MTREIDVIHSATASDVTRIDAIISELLLDDDPDFPVAASGMLRTFLYPCPFQRLPEERVRHLIDFSLGRGSSGYYARELVLESVSFTAESEGQSAEAMAVLRDQGLHAFNKHIEQSWRAERCGVDWRGSWSGWDEAELPLIEHVLVDERRLYAVVFSSEDYGHLVANRDDSRSIMHTWATTPAAELEAYATDTQHDESHPFRQRVLAHATAGLWE